jgi:outer membrane protein assembly factor BamB
VIFGSQDDRLYALERDGRMRWSVELGGDVDSSPALAEDGTIYVGTDDRRLYALRVLGEPPADAGDDSSKETDTE